MPGLTYSGHGGEGGGALGGAQDAVRISKAEEDASSSAAVEYFTDVTNSSMNLERGVAGRAGLGEDGRVVRGVAGIGVQS